MATITVSAYDGVNDPVTSSFDVIVVTINSAPAVTGVDPIEPLVDTDAAPDADPPTLAIKNKLYKAAGTITREFKATVDPGSIGTAKEMLKFRAFVAAPKVVSVTTPVSVGINTYSVSIKAVKASLNDDAAAAGAAALGATKVMIFARDSFGAESVVTAFDVVVNRPPVVGYDLPDVILYRGASGADTEAIAWLVTAPVLGVVYTLDDYFDDLDLNQVMRATTQATVVTVTPVTTGDTTCTFSTSPAQPTGRTATAAVVGPPAVAAIAADLAKATSLATVKNGAGLAAKDQTTLVDGATPNAEVNVNAAAPAGSVGPFTLTITCSDLDDRVSSSAQITVRAGDGT
jgi:hypothetical protein